MTLAVPTNLAEVVALITKAAPRLLELAVTLLIGLIILKVISGVLKRLLRTARVKDTMAQYFHSIISVLLWFLLAILILTKLGLGSFATAISSIVAVLTLGLGFGAQGIVADTIAGIFLSTERSFGIGVRVKAGLKQNEGVIEDMDFRKVRIRDDKGRMHAIPNSEVEKNEWTVINSPLRLAQGKKARKK